MYIHATTKNSTHENKNIVEPGKRKCMCVAQEAIALFLFDFSRTTERCPQSLLHGVDASSLAFSLSLACGAAILCLFVIGVGAIVVLGVVVTLITIFLVARVLHIVFTFEFVVRMCQVHCWFGHGRRFAQLLLQVFRIRQEVIVITIFVIGELIVRRFVHRVIVAVARIDRVIVVGDIATAFVVISDSCSTDWRAWSILSSLRSNGRLLHSLLLQLSLLLSRSLGGLLLLLLLKSRLLLLVNELLLLLLLELLLLDLLLLLLLQVHLLLIHLLLRSLLLNEEMLLLLLEEVLLLMGNECRSLMLLSGYGSLLMGVLRGNSAWGLRRLWRHLLCWLCGCLRWRSSRLWLLRRCCRWRRSSLGGGC